MKKTAIFLLLCSTAFMGCGQKSALLDKGHTIEERTVRMPKPMPQDQDTDSDAAVDSDAMAPAGAEGDDACDPKGAKDQCMLIPLNPEGCAGCALGEGHRPVNKETAKRIMMPLKDTCMAKMKNFKGPKQGAPSHASCSFNSATCSPEGKCVGVKISEEELRKQMSQGQRRQQGPRPGMQR